MVPSSSNVNAKKRKIVGKGEKRVGVAEKLQKTLDHIADEMDKISQASSIRAKEDAPYSLEKCLLMLDEVSGLIEGSSTHLLAIRILANKENRITFCYYMQHKRHLAYDWLGTFTKKHIPHPRRSSWYWDLILNFIRHPMVCLTYTFEFVLIFIRSICYVKHVILKYFRLILCCLRHKDLFLFT